MIMGDTQVYLDALEVGPQARGRREMAAAEMQVYDLQQIQGGY